MKHFLSVFVLALVAMAGVATAEAPEVVSVEVAATETAPSLEEIFALEDAKIQASGFQCWITCDDGAWTVVTVPGLLKCGAAARNFCGAQGCEFTINGITSYC